MTKEAPCGFGYRLMRKINALNLRKTFNAFFWRQCWRLLPFSHSHTLYKRFEYFYENAVLILAVWQKQSENLKSSDEQMPLVVRCQ
jgi:hypothetical protein